MKKLLLALTFALIAAPALATGTPAPVAAPTPPVVDPNAPSAAEIAKIEKIVKSLLEREPNLVMEAAQRFQAKQQEEQMQQAATAIKGSAAELYNAAGSPVGGNAKGDVTVVEFFDYNCGYCKRAHATTQQLKKDDAGVRYVYKQYPILGPTSLTGAQAAMAAHLQGKFEAMHDALMNNKEPLSDASIEKLAAGIPGLDVAKFKADMKGDAVKKQIEADLTLGRKVGVQGTPGFIIADKLYPGAMELAQFKQFVTEARAAKKQ